MKYKVGDVFTIEIANICESGYEMMNSGFTITNEALDAIGAVKFTPPVWRDGAVEIPEPNQNVYYTPKDNFGEGIYHVCDCSPEKKFWRDVYWLPTDEFQMPSIPKPQTPQIEICPFCGSEAGVSIGDYEKNTYSVFCTKCTYVSGERKTQAEAIEAHNKTARFIQKAMSDEDE